MNNFEIYKLQGAGLQNHHILKILSYQEKTGKSLSVRDMGVVSEYRHPSLFLERYRELDTKELKKEFSRFPSFSILDPIYPDSLKEIYDPPVLLFYQGDLSLLEEAKLAVVGGRKATETTVKSVEKVVKELDNRFVIVSGLAKGVDAAAHISAIKHGGKTIAVIGTGLDVTYPKSNANLQTYIAENQLILSEYGPGQAPLKFHFPARNRIIAGLARGVVVAEARMRSGSLITCERALEEGREVFAIPGDILSGNSDGCHHLIQEGAKCITSGMDVLSELVF